MHTFTNRASALFATFTTYLAVVTFLCFLSTLNLNPQAVNSISSSKALVKSSKDYTKYNDPMNDVGHVVMDLDAKLSPIFNWNVKQLFVWIIAEYKTKANSFNQVTLWTRIIKRGEKSDFSYKSITPAYGFWDDGHGFRNTDVKLRFGVNVVPNAGLLTTSYCLGQGTFTFPSEYSKV